MGKHLHGVDDLLQIHALVEADIAAQAERVRAVSAAAQRFAMPSEGECSQDTLQTLGTPRTPSACWQGTVPDPRSPGGLEHPGPQTPGGWCTPNSQTLG